MDPGERPAPLVEDDMTTDPEDPVLEAMIEAEIERAIGPAKGTLPAEILDELRLTLRIGLLYNPGARAVLEQLRPGRVVEKSDKVATAAFKNRKKKETKTGGER